MVSGGSSSVPEGLLLGKDTIGRLVEGSDQGLTMSHMFDPALRHMKQFQGTESMTEGDIKLNLTEELKKEEEESEAVKDFHSCGIGRFRLNQDFRIYVDFFNLFLLILL